MQINESTENYLEMILVLQKQQGMVRSIDIANAMGFSKPSISIAMKRLRENDYIQMDPVGFITLTEKGNEIAQRVMMRHDLLKKLLIALGVSEETAQADACKMEHDLSDETIEAMQRHIAIYAKHMLKTQE